MEFVYNDGGRKEAGFKGVAGDCVTCAIAIITKNHIVKFMIRSMK